MKITRRKFLRHTSLLTAAAAVRSAYAEHDMHTAEQPGVALLDTNALARYVDPLPIPAVMKISGLRRSPIHPSAQMPYYRVPMRQFQARVHRDMPATTLWGYAGACPGPTFEVRRGQPILVEWANELPQRHLLPIDHTIHGAEKDKPEVRTVVHLHGGRTPPESDGYPEDWFVPGKSATCYYPNQQEATALFYHDHAMGITRLNAVAGLSGLYLIRDELEDSLRLPQGAFEIPLVIFDRSFRKNGGLYYPTSGNADAPWVSEYYVSAILVNGAIFPYLEVQPRKYRLRVLNASNGSFYRLSLSEADSISADSVDFVQIGSEQGLLEAPATINTLIIGPGERADLVVDFRGRQGKLLFMRTDAAVFMQFRVSPRNSAEAAELPAA